MEKIRKNGPVDPSSAPKWFVEWYKAFDKKLNARFDKLDKRIDNLIIKNNLKE